MHRSQPRKKEKVERTAEEEEDEDEEDPFDRRIRESGCSAQHYALQVGWFWSVGGLVRRPSLPVPVSPHGSDDHCTVYDTKRGGRQWGRHQSPSRQ